MRIGRWNIEFYNARKHAPFVYGIDHFATGERECRPFAKADIQSILMMISNRMNNVVFRASKQYIFFDEFFKFLHENALAIILKLFECGYVRVDVSDEFAPRIEDVSEEYRVREGKRIYRERFEDEAVEILDDVYRTTGETRRQVLSPHVEMLNTVNDSDLNLIMNYGAMGILSPENSARTDGYIDEDGIKEIQDDYQRKYGVKFGRWALLITKQPVKFQRIDLPIKELELNEKRKSALAEILQYMNIPKELHAMFDGVKYENRNEAELDMYSNTVSAWAAFFCKMAKRCYDAVRIADKNGIGYAADVEVWFDIVGVAALNEAQAKEKEKAREELKMWRELRVEMPERADYIYKRINDIIESL